MVASIGSNTCFLLDRAEIVCVMAAKAILAASLRSSALNVGMVGSLVNRANSVGTPASSSSGNNFFRSWSQSKPFLMNGWAWFVSQ